MDWNSIGTVHDYDSIQEYSDQVKYELRRVAIRAQFSEAFFADYESHDLKQEVVLELLEEASHYQVIENLVESYDSFVDHFLESERRNFAYDTRSVFHILKSLFRRKAWYRTFTGKRTKQDRETYELLLTRKKQA